ncbi:MAG: CPXCG motif-containing cysteine-rich protein [Candidatus Eremiobacteraeota bacterium]|nr:CPXCG motif-containing cysteine-rich protein [Candidatus Eremiobacteraeota bacterium]
MSLEDDVAYTCPYCGESNYVGFDASGGSHQRFVEDCPVCCSPIAFDVRVDEDGIPMLQSATRENP